MGNSQSPATDPKFITASRAFSKEELEDLRLLFDSLAKESKNNRKFISQPVFEEFYGIDGPIANRLFQLITQERNDGMLTFEDLIISKAVYEKGTRHEIDEFIFRLCDVNGDNLLGRDDIESILDSIQKIIFSEEKDQSVNKKRMEVFLSPIFSSENESEGSEGKFMSFRDFKNWCNFVPSVRKFLTSLLIPPNLGKPGIQIPDLSSQNPDSESRILKPEFAWHIAGSLSQQESENWELLYSSSIHGASFNTFLGNISNCEGPTVLVIKDTDGYIFGGFASQKWEKYSDFYGDMKSFLFQLYPHASTFKPTGVNNNIQWCGANFSSESIPNGIGFGGKAHHFGLFLSANFDHGQTFECSTFSSPSLSRNSRFKPDVIECWGVEVREKVVSEGNSKGTVLERFKEDRNMLKLVGLANSSE
ncbi:hypothetical protein LUZ60_007454 [Juncus effusus]|nr:hypothetical protein LUZ60_007454 [Juncus effusus]